MPSISDIPSTPKYPIRVVSSQTGILAVTIRAWERRYEILNPYRAENHYRLYSERDVATLRWIKNRVDEGIPISNVVSELNAMIKNGMWPQTIPDVPGLIATQKAVAPEQFARYLYQSLIQHDELRAGELLRQANTTFDLTTICLEIMTPCLHQIGDAWYRGEIRITTEHFASAFLRGKLLSLFQTYPSRRNAPKVLIGCAPTEQHEISSIMISVILRSSGLRVEFLGPDLPIDDLVEYSRYEHPDMVILSATMVSAADSLIKMQEKLHKITHPPLFGFGGSAFNSNPSLRQKIPGFFLGENLITGTANAQRLLMPLQKSEPANDKQSIR
jgi:methanogenic corrinoid protein MtbC1